MYSPATAFWFTQVRLGSLVDYNCRLLREIIHFIDLGFSLQSSCVSAMIGSRVGRRRTLRSPVNFFFTT